jgi:hypothetical protein
LERFRYPYIRHLCSSICLNSVSKFKVRVLPSILEYIRRKNEMPKRLIFSFAKLIEFYKNGTPIDDEEVMISEVTEDNNSPLAIVNSFSNNITVNFLENNSETKAIEIKENNGESFEKIILTTDKDLRIKKIHAYLSDGNEFVYEITEFTTNQNLPDSMFTFDESLYPNVEIIDMR